jgi:hypothetical protein
MRRQVLIIAIALIDGIVSADACFTSVIIQDAGIRVWLNSERLSRLILMSAPASAPSQVVTITEPGVYKIGGLFKVADVVALVKIVSGDTENYDHTVYKGEVIQSFKGTERGATVYFGPFVGEKLGWEYVLFLRHVAKPIAPKTAATASYGTIHYSEVSNEGYSSMESSYACVFDGKEIAQKCDYGVRVCTDYVKLPKSLPAFPPEDNDPPFGCRWVRKTVFISFIDTLGDPKR